MMLASTASDCSFTDRDFRDALGRFATGVAVITGMTGEGARLGATVSSFSSVSLDPPLVLFSIGRSARASSAWEAIKRFAVNILAEEQSTISTRFARSLTDKWEGIAPRLGDNGSPLLDGALAWLEFTSYAKYDGGDHLILVGRVDALTVRAASDARPLVFFGGKYRRLDSDRLIQTPPDAEQWLHGW
jgi:flavin reductase (DIM6/NTAB) family NADH-FMN oxidoreductase RutF